MLPSFCYGGTEWAGLGFGSSVLHFLLGGVCFSYLVREAFPRTHGVETAPSRGKEALPPEKMQLGVATLSLLETSETQEDLQSFI